MEIEDPEIMLLSIRNLLMRAKVSAVRMGYDRKDEFLIPDINTAIHAIDDHFMFEPETSPNLELPFDADEYMRPKS